MSAFRGTSNHTLDTKGRLIIPARFRSVIKAGREENVMVSKFDGALNVFTMEEWDIFEKNLLEKRSPNMPKIRRFLIGSAQVCPLDKQGRIQLPKELRAYAGIEPEGEVTLVGLVRRFEIWQASKLEDEQESINELMQTEEVREEIMDIGL
ncbi:division/cell wall cluster transcriptional repressor MraZ [Desulfoluna limicola]|nr:division/cell wall cluster transcriptional repressor MraZ [Desulfoluna limicola]